MEVLEKEIPAEGQIYKPSSPYRARIVENRRLTEEGSPDDIRHIVINIEGSGMVYLEGQSVGIIPPGEDEKGKRHRPRLYSIASSRHGDDGTSTTVSLTVKRVLFTDGETGEEVRGVASNFICDLKEGDDLDLTGPIGRTFFLPKDSSVNLIMVSVGTGIAPFRAFLHFAYRERKTWGGKVRLFHGAKTGMESIYMNQASNDIGQFMEEKTFQAFKALSNIENVYIQKRIEENMDEIWEMVKEGNFAFYICGVKGMESGVDDLFRGKATGEGKDWDGMKSAFKEAGRWNVEVY